jgi:hypothetical protein
MTFIPAVTGDADADDRAIPVRRMLADYYDQSLPTRLYAPPPTPVVTTLAPNSIVVATPTAVVVTGTGFTPSSFVWADEEEQATTYISPTQLDYSAEADQVGTQDITVQTRGVASNAVVLTVTATTRASRASRTTTSATVPPDPPPDPAPADPPPSDPPPDPAPA